MWIKWITTWQHPQRKISQISSVHKSSPCSLAFYESLSWWWQTLLVFFCWLPLMGPITFQRQATFFANGSFFDMYFLSCSFGLKTKSQFFLVISYWNSNCVEILLKRDTVEAIVFFYWCLNPYHDCSNLQHKVNVDVRDEAEKLLTDTLSTLFHIVSVNRQMLALMGAVCFQLGCGVSSGSEGGWALQEDQIHCHPFAEESVRAQSASLLTYCPQTISLTRWFLAQLTGMNVAGIKRGF